MILSIKSRNDKLMDLLYKNPSTDFGVYAKPLKNGVVLGYMVSPHQYDVVFQDTKYSYLPEDSNAIDYQSYCNPLVVLNICNELFLHILKQKQDFDAAPITWLNMTQGEADNQVCTIEIPTFYIHSTWYRNDRFLLSKYFPSLEVTPLQGRNFALKITGGSVFEAMNLLNIVALFTHITNEYGMYTYIDDSFAEKYARILTNLDHVPYFVFYLFIRRAIKNNNQFAKVKPVFEQYLLRTYDSVNLIHQNTHQARMNYICNQLDKQIPILDIGCGELLYYKRMVKSGFKLDYYAVDQDKELVQVAKNIQHRLETDNLYFYHELDEVPINHTVQIILSEVIEHNSESDAQALVKRALQFPFSKLFITTPNVSFNIFYSEELDSRHGDHHFEFDEAQFKAFIQGCVQDENNLELSFDFIGDTLNGIQPTQVAIIKRN